MSRATRHDPFAPAATRTAEAPAYATGGSQRQLQLQAAATAIALIVEQIGPAAGLVLLNASLDAVVDRLRAAQERR
jgi:hypothetical protein